MLKSIILLFFIFGVVLLGMGLQQDNILGTANYPSKDILEKRNRDHLLQSVFFNPTPWQQVNNYTKYKGDYFTTV